MYNFLNKVFKLEENKTTVKTEIIAGLTTFFAMCYIVIVNPTQMTGASSGALWNACFVGGIIAGVIATLLMAFIANKPFALAAGMGLNSFFFVSFILPTILNPGSFSAEDGYASGLSIILLSGILFLILSLTGLRKYLAVSLPDCLKKAIPAGIGLFIAFIGLQGAGLVIPNQFVGVQLIDFTKASTQAIINAIVAFVGFILIIVFSKVHVKFLNRTAIILGILSSTALYYILTLCFGIKISFVMPSLGQVFKDWAQYGFSGLTKGFGITFGTDFLGGIISVIMLVITFSLVDMFDTLGTLYGASAEAGMLDENGDPVAVGQEMLCDSIGTVVGAVTGTSTITTFVESSSGIAAGGRTGLSSLVTALMFLICLFLAPVAQLVPGCATAPALMFVGVLMLRNIMSVDFKDLRSAATAFITLIFMVTTYSISNGIMIGAIAYVLITLLTGKYTKKDIVVTVIAVLGILRYAFVAI